MSRTPERIQRRIDSVGGMFSDGTVWWRGKRYSLMALRALALVLSDVRGARFLKTALDHVEKIKAAHNKMAAKKRNRKNGV